MSNTRLCVAVAIALLILIVVRWGAAQQLSPSESISALLTADLLVTSKKSAEKAPANEIKIVPIASENQPDDPVQQKYAILFSALQLSPPTRQQLQRFLHEREVIAGRDFYDAGSNSAEIAENLRQRELDVADIDERIAQLLTDEDAQKYSLLKDSTYEQALLDGFYQVAGMDAVPEQQKLNLLLNKLEQKQKFAELIASATEEIATAAPDTKTFLIEKTHRAFIAGQEDYLRTARAGLSDEQFELLRHYEQQLSDERWQDLLSSWQ